MLWDQSHLRETPSEVLPTINVNEGSDDYVSASPDFYENANLPPPVYLKYGSNEDMDDDDSLSECSDIMDENSEEDALCHVRIIRAPLSKAR